MRRIPLIPAIMIVATWLFAVGFVLAYELRPGEQLEADAVAGAVGIGAVTVAVVGVVAGIAWLAAGPARRRLAAARG
ncbi:hypothetical protein ACFVAJ_05865 [Agromyces sp. NPDC057679]|uniref:hypothetical protein n=1 Tax=Agromyces sp. NPDC057679 TaxID=3346207 RepID=UPI00366D0647